jgi:hypothetical protein
MLFYVGSLGGGEVSTLPQVLTKSVDGTHPLVVLLVAASLVINVRGVIRIDIEFGENLHAFAKITGCARLLGNLLPSWAVCGVPPSGENKRKDGETN